MSWKKLKQGQHYYKRQDLAKYLILLVFLVFCYHIITIKNQDAGSLSLQQKGVNQSTRTIITKARRGDIFDRNGQLLASSLGLKKINLDPSHLQPEFIPKLAAILGISRSKLARTLAVKKRQGGRYFIVKKHISLTDPIIKKIQKLKVEKVLVCRFKTAKIKAGLLDKSLIWLGISDFDDQQKTIKRCQKEKIAGLAVQQHTRRYYPKAASMAALLGRVNQSGSGGSGVELEFDQTLAGIDGKRQLRLDENTKKSYFEPLISASVQHGQDLVLTIDSKLQFYTYDALKNAVRTLDADRGSAIILAPNGEVLALANYPADDPNDKYRYNPHNYRNSVLSDKVEPGSIMKPFTMLLALDEGKIRATDDEKIDVTKATGHIKPDKHKLLTVRQILQKSHNLGTVKIAKKLSKKTLYDTWQKLGFGKSVGLIPSIETAGILRHYHTWRVSDKRTISYGYGPMNANLAQLARAYLVFANQGKIIDLKLIKNAIAEQKTTEVFSPKSVQKIADLLDSVVSNKGSGYRATIIGHNVAGKTGTAELIVKGKYSKKGAKRTFFTGFTPVHKPKYIMSIRLDHPKKCTASWDNKIKIDCQGSNSAAIVFKDAMTKILKTDN